MSFGEFTGMYEVAAAKSFESGGRRMQTPTTLRVLGGEPEGVGKPVLDYSLGSKWQTRGETESQPRASFPIER